MISQTLSVGEERIREAPERLEVDVHERQRGQREREGPAAISEGEVLVAFKPLLRMAILVWPWSCAMSSSTPSAGCAFHRPAVSKSSPTAARSSGPAPRRS